MEIESTEIRSAIQELSLLQVLKVQPEEAEVDDHNITTIPTLPFLSISTLVLQVLG